METPRSTSRIPPDYDHHPVLSRTPSSASHTPLSGPNGEEGSRSPVEQKDEKHASSSSSSGSIRLALEQIDEQKLLTPGKRTNSSLVLDSSSPSRDNLQNSNRYDVDDASASASLLLYPNARSVVCKPKNIIIIPPFTSDGWCSLNTPS